MAAPSTLSAQLTDELADVEQLVTDLEGRLAGLLQGEQRVQLTISATRSPSCRRWKGVLSMIFLAALSTM